MSQYSEPTRAKLQKFLTDYGVVPEQWMFTYLRREDMASVRAKLLKKEEALGRKLKPGEVVFGVNDIAKLEAKRAEHRERTKTVRKNRKLRYGTHARTTKEVLKNLYNTQTLRYMGHRAFDEPFVSAAGNSRSRNAVVFQGSDEQEFLFTLAEVRSLCDLGLIVPDAALREPRNPKVRQGLGAFL